MIEWIVIVLWELDSGEERVLFIQFLRRFFVKYLRLVFGLDCPVSLKDRVHYQTALQSMQ